MDMSSGLNLKGSVALGEIRSFCLEDEELPPPSGRATIRRPKAAQEPGVLSDKSVETRKKAVDRACKALIEGGLMVQDGDSYRIPGQGNDEWAEIVEEPSTADLVAASVANHGRVSQRQLRGSVDGLTRAMLEELVDRLKAEPLGISTPSGVLIAAKGRQAGGVDLMIEEPLDYSMV
ncbi:hypothetical protein So717_17350 [Roseobacter cerasinus]|uniref:Uncharacterized protein n=2 Tax=Roseobacter cerasinus TaxID=2602289 RepID=A0A640VQN2_9RHOB|nr:hypothetical protein So717_17350 [Roseobacter cerasinus]